VVKLDKKLKNIIAVVKLKAQNIWGSSVATWDVNVTKHDLEATRQKFMEQLAEAIAWTRDTDGRKVETSTIVAGQPMFDGATSWTVFDQQFSAVAYRNSWMAHNKTMHLLSNLQGQAADILHNFPAEAPYEDTLRAQWPPSVNSKAGLKWAGISTSICSSHWAVSPLSHCPVTWGLCPERSNRCFHQWSVGQGSEAVTLRMQWQVAQGIPVRHWCYRLWTQQFDHQQDSWR
jgi:hypothetical protein